MKYINTTKSDDLGPELLRHTMIPKPCDQGCPLLSSAQRGFPQHESGNLDLNLNSIPPTESPWEMIFSDSQLLICKMGK